jgi:hypothetical protein
MMMRLMGTVALMRKRWKEEAEVGGKGCLAKERR